MGFGLLFFGYTFMLNVGMEINPDLQYLGFDALPDVLGYILFLLGLRNLRPYSKNFVFAWWLTIPLIAVGAVVFGSEIIALIGYLQKPIETLHVYIRYFQYPLLVFFHLYLCMGIKDLANEVGLPKIVRRSYTAMILTCVYYLAKMILPDVGSLQLSVIISLFFYITVFYMLYYLFSCYARIIYADEEQKSIPNPLMKLLEKSKNKK